MVESVGRRQRIEQLLAASEEFEDRLASWQTEQPDQQAIRDAQREYQDWFAAALRDIRDEDRADFEDRYKGGEFIKRVRAFLNDPLATNPFFEPDDPNPLVGRWLHPFESTFRDNVIEQRAMLVAAMHAEAGPSTVLDELTSVFRRLPDYLSVLRQAANVNVPESVITNEADLQVLVHGILRLLYDDVRPEDPVPQQAGGGSRVDFLLREAGVIVETKMTRPGLTDRRLGEELLIDWGRYPGHPDCRAIFALVYDPDRRLSNSAALEHDLSQQDREPATRVLVVR